MTTVLEPQQTSSHAVAAKYLSPFICRVSGRHINDVLQLADARLGEHAAEICRLDRQIALQRERLSAALFTVIGGVTDKRLRNTLLGARRKLFNGRRPAEADLAVILTASDSATADLVRDATAALDQRQNVLSAIELAYARALASARSRFSAALYDEDFQAGLALSSSTLFRNLQTYQESPETLGRSRLEQVERGLLRYFTRMALKATPFGRFCAVVGADFLPASSGGDLLIGFDASPAVKRSAVRLNKRICATLWRAIRSRAAVRDRLVVERNPTLIVEQERFVFLTGEGLLEAFHRVPESDAIHAVLQIADAAPPPKFAELVHALAADPRVDASVDEARAYLDRLIDLGLLRTQSVVPEQEADWLPDLLDFVAAIHDERAQAVADLLRDLRALVDRYGRVTGRDRSTVLEEIRRRLDRGLESLELPAFGDQDLLLYEDATAEAVLGVQRTPSVVLALARLSEWVRLTLPLAGYQAEMAEMRHFFDTFYAGSEGASGVSLLRFYEDFYRHHFKNHLDKTHKARRGQSDPEYDLGNPFGLKAVIRQRQATERLFAVVRRAWAANPAAEEVNITVDAVRQALESLVTWDSGFERSVTFFCQFDNPKGQPARVVLPSGGYGPGYGKFYSRFLYILPDRWSVRVAEANEDRGGALLSEICGDAAFNANLHPPLLPFEISYPTGEQNGSASQLLSSELRVVPDEDPERLVLVRTDGRRVWPIDLGFLNPNMRPPLFQLLTRFSPVRFFGLAMAFTPISRKVDEPGSQAKGVVHRPRIVFEEAVVLARRSWLVWPDAMPVPQPAETDAQYFLRVEAWREENGIPARVYARVRPLAFVDEAKTASPVAAPDLEALEGQAVNIEEPADADSVIAAAPAPEPDDNSRESNPRPVTAGRRPKPSRDFQKPQFIDFYNPLLLNLFSHLPGALRNYVVVLQECLPSTEQLPAVGDSRFAYELILQLSFQETNTGDADDPDR